MKLLLIYGSPAVGKLTTARAIANRTDFRVFHNHLTISAVKPVFDFGTAPFWQLVHLFRIETIRAAARENVDLIYTFCYAKDEDDPHVAEVAQTVEENGGEICFVLLVAEKAAIEKRVAEDSRRTYEKLGSPENLRATWERYELFSPVNGRESLVIDNTELSPDQTAERIIEHFNLARKKN